MPLFNSILRTEDLPTEGSGREAYVLDFKTEVDEKDTFELAKDVAALANATGGVVLVGAMEDRKRSTLGRYNSKIDQHRAGVVAAAYSKATAQRCSPAPLVNPVAIERIPSEYVVAINVWPFPSQPVGVRTDVVDAYAFPIRIGLDTSYLTPEQLPMLMLPEIRHAAIVLSQIDAGTRILVYGGEGAWVWSKDQAASCKSVSIDLMSSMARFHIEDAQSVDVPLADIDLVWRDSSDNAWRVSFKRGRLRKSRNGTLRYDPNHQRHSTSR